MNNNATTEPLAWFKSSYSGAEGGQCVEVAAGGDAVHVRDSKAASGPALRVSMNAWAGLIRFAATDRTYSL
ncbi:DUF397 domain-containing protein [Streptomyces sp. OfavH-34-F]|uniref:DUF397 domain-containing protein n=1 Tax=Streptomyces sp. OfavH-34-F TaxID=2917760 RepID=UPI001EF16BD0|nr:DUF397 domain-containing protein [Streptomyces sp. OfavH-34-F]MCG7526642.1 DUF397 domain-containing protein [Streptomyces sp. OfavH-34-F]